MRGQGTGAAGAVASSVVGVALFATLGVGWISIPKGPTVTSVRVRGTDLPGGAGIAVTGFAGMREVDLPEIAATVDASLLVAEREILRRRQTYGLEMPVHELFMRP